MSALELAAARLTVEEGFRSAVYVDTTGHRTIGYGCNLDAGLSKRAAAALLEAQLSEVADAIGAYWWFQGLDDVRASVLLDLAMNLGVQGLLHFPRMLSAIGDKNWQGAHDELLNSEAAVQLPNRYQALARSLLMGG